MSKTKVVLLGLLALIGVTAVAVAQQPVQQSGAWTMIQGAANSIANAWPFKVTDGTNTASVKAASTAAVATDPALVVAVSPNNSVAVTGTFWQATQPVSGTFWQTTQPVSGTFWQTTQPVSGTFWQATQPVSDANLELAQASTTSGQKGPLIQCAGTTGAPTYTTAQTNPISCTTAGAVRVDGSGVTQPVSGTFWQATQPVSGTVTTTPPSNASTNVTQFGGTNVSTGTGAGGAGIPRVTVSNDSNVLATQSGTWTVQPGNTANTTPWLMQPVGGTTNGSSTCNLQSAATTNATNCKASAGTLYGYEIINTTGTIYYLRLYNLSAAPTCSSGTGFIRSIPIPAATSGAGVERDMATGEAYGTGLGFCLTGGGSSSDNTNAATGVYVSLLYK